MAAVDDYVGRAPLEPATSGAAVTPNDSTDLSDVTRLVWVGGAGNLTVIMKDGQTVTLTAVAAGAQLPIRVSRIKATGTTATNIAVFW